MHPGWGQRWGQAGPGSVAFGAPRHWSAFRATDRPGDLLCIFQGCCHLGCDDCCSLLVLSAPEFRRRPPLPGVDVLGCSQPTRSPAYGTYCGCGWLRTGDDRVGESGRGTSWPQEKVTPQRTASCSMCARPVGHWLHRALVAIRRNDWSGRQGGRGWMRRVGNGEPYGSDGYPAHPRLAR